MGQARRRRAALDRFLAEHPICCFCGGGRPAETGDHVPGRAIFLERKWPEGYLFPACEDCNAATSRDEMLIAVLARAFPNAETEVEQREFRLALDGLANNWPEMILKLAPTFEQRAGSPFDVFDLSDPDVRAAIRRWGGKLGLALYYLHTSRIVPAAGGVIVWTQTNRQFHEDGFPPGLVEVMHGVPELQRTNHPLGDQFSYLYSVIEGGRGSILTCRLRLAMFLHLFVSDDVAEFPIDQRETAVRPFSYPTTSPGGSPSVTACVDRT